MNEILKYFPKLTDVQRAQFVALEGLYAEWNGRINVVSRKDMGEFHIRHVLHSLALARVCEFTEGARVLDVGTGGGFPVIPLAIMFPAVRFTAVDSIGKKIRVVEEISRAIDLKNLTAVNFRAENVVGKFDYVVSRAVASATQLLDWTWSKIERGQKGTVPNGALFLKGGDLNEELAQTGRSYTLYSISRMFAEPFFETKQIVRFER